MKQERIHSLRVTDLIFPLIRPLASVFACLREMEESGYERPSEVISSELSHIFNYISRSIEKLSVDSEISVDEIGDLLSQIRKMEQWQGSRQGMIKILNVINQGVTDFCRRNKSVLRTAYNSDKGFYRNMFREFVSARKVCMIHGKANGEAASTITDTLTNGCYYDVELVPEWGYYGSRSDYDILSFFTLDPTELSNYVTSRETPEYTLILLNLGGDVMQCDPTLLRVAAQLSKQNIRILYRPFSTLRLLQEFERAYYHFCLAEPLPLTRVSRMEADRIRQVTPASPKERKNEVIRQ